MDTPENALPVQTPVVEEVSAPVVDVVLTNEQKVAAATNNPVLAEYEFSLGDRAFKVVDLDYNFYIEFLSKLQPLLEAVMGKLAGNSGLSIPGVASSAELSVSSIMLFCKGDLPEMVSIVCNMQEYAQANLEKRDVNKNNLVDSAWVRANGKNPFVLSNIVMSQVGKNNIIADFATFFVQTVLPIARPLMTK